jgi:hypothetical protein
MLYTSTRHKDTCAVRAVRGRDVLFLFYTERGIHVPGEGKTVPVQTLSSLTQYIMFLSMSVFEDSSRTAHNTQRVKHSPGTRKGTY